MTIFFGVKRKEKMRVCASVSVCMNVSTHICLSLISSVHSLPRKCFFLKVGIRNPYVKKALRYASHRGRTVSPPMYLIITLCQ